MSLAAEDATLRGVDLDRNLLADRETLERVGLHPQHLAAGERRVILADVAEKHVVGDPRARRTGGAGGGVKPDILRTNGDVDGLAGLEPVERGDVEGKLAGNHAPSPI